MNLASRLLVTTVQGNDHILTSEFSFLTDVAVKRTVVCSMVDAYRRLYGNILL